MKQACCAIGSVISRLLGVFLFLFTIFIGIEYQTAILAFVDRVPSIGRAALMLLIGVDVLLIFFFMFGAKFLSTHPTFPDLRHEFEQMKERKRNKD